MQKRRYLKVTAICSFLGAITTALLIFLPNPQATDFESRMLLHQNSMYMTKLWILFIHPQVNLLAALGIAYLLLKKYPLPIIFGTFFLLSWAFAEMSQQALLIDAVNQIWRPGYIEADTEEARNQFTTLIEAANGISDSKYFQVIYSFGLGSFFLGLAFIHEDLLGRFIGFSLLFIGVLSLSSFLRYYLAVSSLNGIVNWIYEWIYPYLQPAVRVAIGIWVLQRIDQPFSNSSE